MILDVWNYLRGYAIIEVEGFSVERFINLAVHKGIYLWNIRRKQNGVQMHVSLKGYEILKECARKTLCDITILHKKGFPVFMQRYKKRKVFFIGSFLFILSLYLFSSYIWDIEIYGNQKLTDLQVLQRLEKEGLSIGKLKKSINPNAVEQKVIDEFHEIAWISIGIKGTKAIVRLTETTPKPPMIDRTTPCDIVAAKDGIIQNVIIQSGDLKISKDMVVRKGDLLISGTIPMADETIKLVHASGEIEAKVWYSAKAASPLQVNIGKRTGRVEKRYALKIGRNLINLYDRGVSFKEYDKIVSKKTLHINENAILPVEWVTNSYYEKKNTIIKVNREAAKKNAVLKGMQILHTKMPTQSKIFQTDIQYDEKDGNIIAKITLINLERIDQKKKIESRGNEFEQTNGENNSH